MNWTLLITIILTLVNPFDLDLASGNNTVTIQEQFDKLELQAQTEEESVTVTQTLGPDGGSIIVDFMGQPRKVYFPPDALVKNTEITVKVTNTVAMSYPEDADFLDIYRPDLLNYVGPQLIVELPTDALDWQNEEILKVLIELDSGVYNGLDTKTLETTAEVRTLLSNGNQALQIKSYYYANDPAILFAGDLQDSYLEGIPTNTKISIQIVDRSPFFNQALTDEEPVTVTQTLGPDGGSIIVDFMGQPREVIFAPGALLTEIPIIVTVTESVDTTYPSVLSQDSSFNPQLLEYVGPQIIVEVPKGSLDWDNDDGAKPLFGVNSGLNIPFNYDLHLNYEIRTSLSGDDVSMEFQRYLEGDYAAILAGGISALGKFGLPDVIKFSIQIVDYTEMDE